MVIRGCEIPKEERPRSDSPCASRDSLQLLFMISATKDWSIKLVDVKNAFLQSHEVKPSERIHVIPPRDLRKEEYCWELLKPVYGEGDACHRWWVTLSGFLQEIGGVVSKLDHCVLDHAFYLRGLLTELLTREESVVGMTAISDSKDLVSNLHSCHQPKDYRLRFDLAQIQQYMGQGLVVRHMPGCSQMADPLSKRTASAELLLECVQNGELPKQCKISKEKEV